MCTRSCACCLCMRDAKRLLPARFLWRGANVLWQSTSWACTSRRCISRLTGWDERARASVNGTNASAVKGSDAASKRALLAAGSALFNARRGAFECGLVFAVCCPALAAGSST